MRVNAGCGTNAQSGDNANGEPAVDYDPRAEITREFFATVQNKMHYAVHEHTAAEVIYERVESDFDKAMKKFLA